MAASCPASPRDASAPDARVAACLLAVLFVGAVAVLSLPAARGHSAALGWMPLWLLGMPLSSLAAWCLRRWPLPRRASEALPMAHRRRVGKVQARRRPAARRALPRAA